MNKRILEALEKVEHRLGPITRKDGMVIPVFFDTVPLMFYPDTFKVTVEEMAKVINTMSQIDVIAGGLTPGVPLAAGVALYMGKRFAWVRKEPKGYSQNRVVDGDVKVGDRVVLLDDFYVSGEMKELFMGHLNKLGAEVTDIFSIGLLSERLLNEWKPKFPDLRVHYLADYVDMSRHFSAKRVISQSMREVLDYFVTDPYGWQENKEVWEKFNSLLPTEPLAEKHERTS